MPPRPGKWGLQPFPEPSINHGGGSSAFEFSLLFLHCHTLPAPVFSLNLPYIYNWRTIFKNMYIFIGCISWILWKERCYIFLTIKENPNLSSFPLKQSQLIFSLSSSDGLCQTEEFSAPALNGLRKPNLKWYFIGLLEIPVLLGFTRGMVERGACCFNSFVADDKFETDPQVIPENTSDPNSRTGFLRWRDYEVHICSY